MMMMMMMAELSQQPFPGATGSVGNSEDDVDEGEQSTWGLQIRGRGTSADVITSLDAVKSWPLYIVNDLPHNRVCLVHCVQQGSNSASQVNDFLLTAIFVPLLEPDHKEIINAGKACMPVKKWRSYMKGMCLFVA